MTNREFSEASHGPADTDGPSVDELRQSLRTRRINPAEGFHYREKARVTDHEVHEGKPVNDGSRGEISEADMAEWIKTASTRQLRQAPDLRSYVDQRDMATGEVIRTYADGRSEAVAEEDRGRRSRPV
ncbi:hypothetical protein ACFQL8_17145 [Streptomyces goshikiensis]|uniref:hypothetical protein n=1 Tax=Streptomyces goshikiensis TaxID=1942 RepID=UPI0016757CFC|nr:hypothetical protein [Streptomyces goshikiensis]GHD56015.1 hypothetical protein GCM10010336_00860 [Streptomyces goshikiensis]